jgi:hypothetical protein
MTAGSDCAGLGKRYTLAVGVPDNPPRRAIVDYCFLNGWKVQTVLPWKVSSE